jgi:hypothetical protein
MLQSMDGVKFDSIAYVLEAAKAESASVVNVSAITVFVLDDGTTAAAAFVVDVNDGMSRDGMDLCSARIDTLWRDTQLFWSWFKYCRYFIIRRVTILDSFLMTFQANLLAIIRTWYKHAIAWLIVQSSLLSLHDIKSFSSLLLFWHELNLLVAVAVSANNEGIVIESKLFDIWFLHGKHILSFSSNGMTWGALLLLLSSNWFIFLKAKRSEDTNKNKTKLE